MKKNYYSIFFLLFLSLPLWSAAQAYHTDPNTSNSAPTIGVAKANTINGILLSNSSTVDVNILLSDDKHHWDTVKIPKESSLSFQTTIKYIKVFTSADKFIYVVLNSGNAYTLFWDSSNSKWNIN